MLALEAMAVGTPVLCNARAEVLVEHCTNSNAGLFYQDRDEFVECAKLLLADDRLRDRMGRNGKEYVKTAIAPYKYPREIEFLAALPRTETGKLQRFKLRHEGRKAP